MAKKIPISVKLAKRKYRPAPRPFAAFYKFVMVDLVGHKYKPNFHIIDDVNDCDGPCIVIFNHLSRIDHVYVCGATYPRITNMMAGYSEFYRKITFKNTVIYDMKNPLIDKKELYVCCEKCQKIRHLLALIYQWP